MNDFTIQTLGDSCLSVVFPSVIAPAVNARCVALAEAVRASRVPGIRDVVPAYHTVAVHFDPRKLSRAALGDMLRRLPDGQPAADRYQESDRINIPVRYGGEDGPDLSTVAAFAGCSEEEVIRRHSASAYRVYMLGFLPGFAYMGSVEPSIAMPRLETPRLRVPAGSVGIAGAQTGVYPRESPGGWRIIGRSEAAIFDPAASEPFRFKPGDTVRFVRV